MASYLITGSSRGIGLDLVTYLLSLPANRVKTVFATARDSKNSASLVSLANSPEGLGRIVLVTLDVRDNSSIDNATVTVQRALGMRNGLDVLINNTCLSPERKGITERTEGDATQSLQTVVGAFLPIMRRGAQKKVIHLGATSSSTEGPAQSVQEGRAPSPPTDTISKTTLSTVSMQWAMTLRDEGFTVAAMFATWICDDTERVRVQSAGHGVCKAIVDKIDGLNQRSNGIVLDALLPEMEHSESMQLETL